MSTYTTKTENGDAAFATSGNKCLDFFTRITRGSDVKDYVGSFAEAWSEDKSMAYQILMNLRDIRGGKGEKLIPEVIVVYLKQWIEPAAYEAILRRLVDYGYWKDLLRIVEIEARMFNSYQKTLPKSQRTTVAANGAEAKLFAEQLKKDLETLSQTDPQNSGKKASISLCAKWAPSEKSHYDHYPMGMTAKIKNAMSLEPKPYRQMLTKLRAHLNVLETLMATGRFEEIDFSKVPAVAMKKWKQAFGRDTNAAGKESDSRKKLHQSYEEFLQKLAAGKTKVNVKGIHPHELVATYFSKKAELDPLVEGQWTELVKRVQSAGVFDNVMAIVDVSDSMKGVPMQVSVALGILVATCTTGQYHGKVIPFSTKAQWHELKGGTLKEMVQCMKHAPWKGSTNLRAALDLILADAKVSKLPAEQMVKTLFIFTDMQFNDCDRGNWESTFEYAKRTYLEAGYQLPNIVCWNLRTSKSQTLPVQSNDKGFVMLSGFSAELLKCILTGSEFTPMAMMKHVLDLYAVPAEVVGSKAEPGVLGEGLLVHLADAVTKSAIKSAYLDEQKKTVIKSDKAKKEKPEEWTARGTAVFNGATSDTDEDVPILVLATESSSDSSSD